MIRKVSIPQPLQDQVSAKISIPADFSPGRDPGIILAHGAGNDMENSMLVFLAEGLARAGVLALRFNFPYKDAGRTAPDKPEVLEASWESTFDYLNPQPLYRPVLAKIKAPWKLEIIEGGDHFFEVPKSTGRSREAVYQLILDKTVGLIEGDFFGR